MSTMFDTLLQLPLFQGLCHEDFNNILEKIKFDFAQHKKGNIIIEQDAPCNHLIFLIKGIIAVETISKDGTYSFIEHIEAPAVIEPQVLFGMQLNYTATYYASTEADTVAVSKSFIINGLLKYEIFRLNYLNVISNYAQNAHNRLWYNSPTNVEEKIINFILTHVHKYPGTKVLKTKMDDLARNLNDTRLNVSKALNSLNEKNVIELKRKEIIIHDVSKLIWVNSKVDCIIY